MTTESAVAPDRTHNAASGLGRARTTRYAAAGVEAEEAKLRDATEGFRHHEVYRVGCRLGELLAGGQFREDDFLAIRDRWIGIGVGHGLSRRDAERQLDRGIETGRHEPRSGDGGHDRAEVIVALAEFWHAAQADPRYADRKGATSLRILAALAMLAAGAGKTTLTDSFRRIAEAAGVTVSTVHGHTDRLAPYVTVDAGWRGTETRTRWTLHLTAVTEKNNPAAPGVAPQAVFLSVLPDAEADPLTDPADGRWQQRPWGWRLYTLLAAADEGVTEGELAEATGRHPRTVRRWLALFAEWGVAVRCGDRWYRPRGREVAADTFHLDRRRERHARDRGAWRDKLARLAAERDRERERTRPPLPLADPDREEPAVAA